MALRGNLAEASLPDVVQLLALGRRTGRLSAARDSELGTIYFIEGGIALATLAHRRDPLGAALVRRGVLDDADLCAALAEQATEPDTPLGALLVRRGCVPRDALLAQLTQQTEEAAYELVSWTRGTFSFEAAPPVSLGITLRLDAGAILLEAARRADEAVLIATEVPGVASVFALVPGQRVGGLDDAEVERVAALLDGARDVQAITDAAGLSTFHVSRAVYHLVRGGRARRVVGTERDGGSARVPTARAQEHFNLGVAFARAGLLDEALRELRRAFELRPSDALAGAHLGAVALRAGRLDEAGAVLGDVAARPGATADATHALGVVRHRLGHYELAEEAYERAGLLGLAADPRHLTARAALALDRAQWAVARGYVARARSAWAEPPAVWFHYAMLAAMGVGDLAAAADLAREARAAHPRSPVLIANDAALALLRGGEANSSRALAAVEAAIAESPHLAAAHRLHGELLHRAGRHDRARDAYATAARLDPDGSAPTWARLGSLALRAGEPAAARQAWERACSLQPDHPTARANLAALSRSGAEAPSAV